MSLKAAIFVIFATFLALPFEQDWGLPLLFKARGPVNPPEEVAIVATSSAAGEQMGLPGYTGNWPRTVYADLIRKLHAAGARLVVLDIAFKQPRTAEEDQALAHALEDAGNAILFTYLRRYQVSATDGWADIEEVISPAKPLADAALASGSFTLPKYPARVFQAELWHTLGGNVQPSQPLLAFLALQSPDSLQALNREIGGDQPLEGGLMAKARQLYSAGRNAIPDAASDAQHAYLRQLITDASPRFINYYGPPGSITTHSIADVMARAASELEPNFAKKIVYVGFADTVQTDQRDAYRTVYSNKLGVDLSGVEISATVLANLLQKSFVQPFSYWQALMVAAAFFALGAFGLPLPLWGRLSMQTGALVVYILFALWQFKQYQRWWPLLVPGVALLFGAGFAWLLHYRQSLQRVRAISKALGHYLPPLAAERLGRDFNVLENRHQLVHGVCLMTDIKGYTRLSEQLPPDELHELMNDYYALLVEAIQRAGGTVGNIVGDSLLAIWTGDAVTPAMCEQAFGAAEEIERKIAVSTRIAQKLPTCIALHGGKFSLGNLGAAGHFEYSPVGDIINTTARVEHFNRNLGTRFLCTAPVARFLIKSPDGNQRMRYLGDFEMRNRSAAVGLYTLATDQQLAEAFAAALNSYIRGDINAAQALFAAVAEESADGPSLYYLDLCMQACGSAPAVKPPSHRDRP